MSHEKLRILHVVGTGAAGGVESLFTGLIRHIDSTRYELSVCVVGKEGDNSASWRAAGVRTQSLSAEGRIGFIAALKYIHAVFAIRPHVLHAHVGGRFIRWAARAAGCRQIILHFHGQSDDWTDPGASLDEAKRTHIRNALLPGTTTFIACSQDAERTLLSVCPELAGKVSVIPNGVDLGRFIATRSNSRSAGRLRAELGIADTAQIVGFVGRLTPQKGVSHLIAATAPLLREHPDLHVVIVGDGPLRRRLEDEAAKDSNGRIHFIGERQDVPEVLAAFDLLAVPSEWEPFGIVNVEAMACGIPVVAFDVGGIPEIVQADVTGILAPKGDDQALANAIARLLADNDARRGMGEAGRHRAEREFDIGRFVKRIEDMYSTLKGEVLGTSG